jgi:hypothetical protein
MRRERRQDDASAARAPERVENEFTPEPSVLRIKKRKQGWEPVPRALITDSRLQFDTRGFAAWLLTKPPGWEIRVGALPYLLKNERGPGERIGRDKVRRFLRELEVGGYVTRRRMRKADGRWLWQIDFTDTPPMKAVRTRSIDGSAVDGSATGGTAIDGQGVDLLHTLNSTKPDKCNPTTTAAPHDKTGYAADRSGDELRYPDCFRGAPLDGVRRSLAGCPLVLRQAVLDEVDAMHKSGKVRRPLGLLSALVRSAVLGQFSPNYSLGYDRSRTMAERCREAQVEGASKSISGEPVALSELGRKVLSGLRERLTADILTDAATAPGRMSTQ